MLLILISIQTLHYVQIIEKSILMIDNDVSLINTCRCIKNTFS